MSDLHDMSMDGSLRAHIRQLERELAEAKQQRDKNYQLLDGSERHIYRLAEKIANTEAELAEARTQIDGMKCCWNCKHKRNNNTCDLDNLDCNEDLDKWQLMEEGK